MDLIPYTRKVQYYENDPMGIVHHSNYIRWFEETRVDYMEQMGYGYRKAAEAGVDFAVLGVSCEYKSMVRFGDTVKIYMSVIALDATKLTIAYRVVDEETNQLRATGESRHCFFSAIKKRPVPLKKELPELYELIASTVPGISKQSMAI